jgi:hypothetical protein
MRAAVECIITFANTKDAIMGERLLLDSGIDTRVMPMPARLGPACGMALRVDRADMPRAQSLLGDAIAAIYRRPDDIDGAFIPWTP